VIIFWNCTCGLINKLNAIKELINKVKPWFIFISECKLKNLDIIKENQIVGYNLEVSNTNLERICCYLSSDLVFIRVDPLSKFEVLTFDLIVEGIKYKIMGFYRPFENPNNCTSQGYLAKLLQFLGNMITNYTTIIGCDINIDLNKNSYEMESLQRIGSDQLTTYADDSYVLDSLEEKVKETSLKHVKFLQDMGMIVNTSKTEVTIFGKQSILMNFEVDGSIVRSQTTMKILGIQF